MESQWSVRVFPIIQMLMCAGASLVYLLNHDYRRALYWACAAMITASVTF